jgi:serine/threonine protein kinase
MRARLREEAHLATYLQHPRIARTLGPYEVQGVLYIVSDWVEGTSINSLITYSQMREKFLSPLPTLMAQYTVGLGRYVASSFVKEQDLAIQLTTGEVDPIVRTNFQAPLFGSQPTVRVC